MKVRRSLKRWLAGTSEWIDVTAMATAVPHDSVRYTDVFEA
jgi:hypothetical protein